MITDCDKQFYGVVGKRTGCCLAVAIGDTLEQFIHPGGGGVAAEEGDCQDAAGIGVGADGGAREDDIAGCGGDGSQVA